MNFLRLFNTKQDVKPLMANIVYLAKLYMSAIVIYMTMDIIKGLNSFVGLKWFFDWGCVAALVIICAAVTITELKGTNLDTIGKGDAA